MMELAIRDDKRQEHCEVWLEKVGGEIRVYSSKGGCSAKMIETSFRPDGTKYSTISGNFLNS